MLRQKPKQLNIHSLLYTKIPKNHTLNRINDAIDLSFINEQLAHTYCNDFGRPAKEPALMCKILILQHLYNLSDEQVIEQGNFNLIFLNFLGLNPDEFLPERSLISKFKKYHLKDVITLEEIMHNIVTQCVEKGIITDTSVSVDATHIQANTIKKTPERLMKQLAKKIFKSYQEESHDTESKMVVCPNYKEITDHQEAKKMMKEHLEKVIDTTQDKLTDEHVKTKAIIEETKTIIDDAKFMEQKGVRSLVDKEARAGRKSKSNSFFGYKTEFIMTTEDQIITAIKTADGAYVDGTYTKELLDQTQSAGLEIKEVYGDKAYFRKPILDAIKEIEAKSFIPVSECVYKIDESQFSYNKDADEWQCSEGNITTHKKYFEHHSKKRERKFYKYYFEKEKCRLCPKHETCAKTSVRKILAIGVNTTEFYEIAQEQKKEIFLEKYKKRASIESKNAELKRFHGLSRAHGYSLKSVSMDAVLSAIAVNFKRIAAIINEKEDLLLHI